MSSKIKTGPKVLVAALVLGGAVFGVKFYLANHGDARMASVVPQKSGALEDFKEAPATPVPTGGQTVQAGLPGTAVVGGKDRVKLLEMAWNGQMGLNLANGGANTTEGSLMAKHGVNLGLERQDDYSKMSEELVSCAVQLSKGSKVCHTGANFVIIMGDGAPTFLAGLNEQLGKLGPDFKAEVIGAAGRSNGEDKYMAPADVKADPQKARGSLVAGVLKDGDWNLAMFWAAENEICNNPDVATYDPNCLNWVGTSSFTEAAEKYIQGACEDRPVVSNGKKTGKTQHICVNSAVVWTPADVSIAKKKGGLVSIINTRENASQMAATIIGLRGFDKQNHDLIVNLLAATFEGGEQIKSGGPAALKRAGEISASIYKEENGAYWAKYYRGVEEEDAQGNVILLGGSKVFNLADNLRYFGLDSGAANAYAATYKMFGDIAHQQYPVDLATYPALEEVLNTQFIQDVASTSQVKGKADEPSFADAPTTDETIAKKSWHINFDTGKASFQPAAADDLKRILATLVVASDTVVVLQGHTDDAGDPQANMRLSEARARAVKTFLEKNAPSNFPVGRVSVVAKGQTEPLVPNTSAGNRAKNRRVDIVLKSNQ